MGLRKKQSEFVFKIADLIKFAESKGYELTFGDAYRDPRLHGQIGEKKGYGHSKSCHKLRLGIDFNLFIEGEYKTDTESHRLLGEYWESIGGTWGGRFKDANHYSMEHQGMR